MEIKHVRKRKPVQITKMLPQGARLISVEYREEYSNTVEDQTFVDKSIGFIHLKHSVPTYSAACKYRLGKAAQAWFDKFEPKHLTDKIYFPYLSGFPIGNDGKFRTVHPILRQVNSILHADNEENAKSYNVARLTYYFYEALAEFLVGSNGVLAKDVLSFRTTHSVAAVAIPGYDLDPGYVALDSNVAKKAGIEDGDWGVLIRYPVIWSSSCLLTRAKVEHPKGKKKHSHSNVLRCSPGHLRSLGLDFDGDRVVWIRAPKTEKIYEQISESVHNTGRDGVPVDNHIISLSGEWEDEFLLHNPRKEMDFDGFRLDVIGRLSIDGMSVSPKDITDPDTSKFFQLMEVSGCKKIPEHIHHYGGLPQVDESYETLCEQILRENAKLKLEIGPIGAITDRLLQLGFALELPREDIENILKVKESMSQTLMDSKHGELETSDIRAIRDLLERRGLYSIQAMPLESYSSETRRVLEQVVPDTESVDSLMLIIDTLLSMEMNSGISEACRVLTPVFACTWNSAGMAELKAFMDARGQDRSVTGMIMEETFSRFQKRRK